MIDFCPLVFRISRESGGGGGYCDRGHVAGDGMDAVGREAVDPGNHCSTLLLKRPLWLYSLGLLFSSGALNINSSPMLYDF